MVPEAEKMPKPEHCSFGVDIKVGSQMYNSQIGHCTTALKSLTDKIQAKKAFSDPNYVEKFLVNGFMADMTDWTDPKHHLKKFLTDYMKDTSSPNSIDTQDHERVQCFVDQVEELHKPGEGSRDSIANMANELSQLLRRIDYETAKPAETKHTATTTTEATTNAASTKSTGSSETMKSIGTTESAKTIETTQTTGTVGTAVNTAAESAKATEAGKSAETLKTGVDHLPRIY